jgi:hypothetical protein
METVDVLVKKHKTTRCHIREEWSVLLVEEWENVLVIVLPPPPFVKPVQGLALLFLEQWGWVFTGCAAGTTESTTRVAKALCPRPVSQFRNETSTDYSDCICQTRWICTYNLRKALRPLACWDCGFESHRGHACLPVVNFVCCQVEVSAFGWSLVQRNPTECGVCVSVIVKPR